MQIARRLSGLRHDIPRSPWAVAAVVLVVYGIWLGLLYPRSHNGWTFIGVSEPWIHKSRLSPAIVAQQGMMRFSVNNGYDGQWYYYLALDPLRARYYMDNPPYRYERIAYPMLARLLALADPARIPPMLLLINYLAIGGGTLALAAWLRGRGVSPWFALVYGAYPGFLVSLKYDLAEALAFGLLALGMYLLQLGGARGPTWASLAFALAVLTRETTAIFPLVFALARLSAACRFIGLREAGAWRKGPLPRSACAARPTAARSARPPSGCVLRSASPGAAPAPRIEPDLSSGPLRRVGEKKEDPPPMPLANGRAGAILLLALLPFVLYKWLLIRWFGTSGYAPDFPQVIPFHGLLHHYPWPPRVVEGVRSVVLPALICAVMGLWALSRRAWTVEVWLLLANILLFIVLLNPSAYGTFYDVSRIAAGVMLSALTCIPCFDRLTGRNRWWLWTSCALWLSLTPFLLLFPSWQR